MHYLKPGLVLLAGLCLVSCKEKTSLAVSHIKAKQIAVAADIEEDPKITAFIQPYKKHIDKEMNSVLSFTPKTLSKNDGQLNTAIGNMEADAVLEMATPIFQEREQKSIDAVLLNHGGIRSIISKGNITTKTAFNIMPFENELVIVGIKGKHLHAMFDYLAQNKTAHPLAGMQLILDKNGSIKSKKIQGKNLEDDRLYYIATNDYLMEGGDRMDFFKKKETATYIDYKLRNLFLDYFKKHDTINPLRDQRFIQE